MNAHQRREALLGWLRGRFRTTTAQAAARFDVTQRTILRDIEALRAQGEPIASSSGPGGGFSLAISAHLRPVRLAVEEVLGLALATRLAKQASAGLPYSGAADAAVNRLIGTLPPERAKTFRHLVQRITVGPPASSHMNEGIGAIEADLLSQFEEAFYHCRAVSFEYMDRHGQSTSRVIEPHGFLVCMPIWYVIAHDRLRDAARMFRIDRITHATLLDETFEQRPASWFAEYIDPRWIEHFGPHSPAM